MGNHAWQPTKRDERQDFAGEALASRSWDQLLSAKETLEEHGKQLRGIDGKGGFIYGDLRTRVAVDWNIDVQAITAFDGREADLRIVTRADGRPFQVVWEGADPNGMVLRYLKQNRAD